VQKHAMALGYFSLSVFCILTAGLVGAFQLPLLISALLAMLMGVAFLCTAFAAQLRACMNWFTKASLSKTSLFKIWQIARQPPVVEPIVPEKHTT
jgi:hypothetical protein